MAKPQRHPDYPDAQALVGVKALQVVRVVEELQPDSFTPDFTWCRVEVQLPDGSRAVWTLLLSPAELRKYGR
jgi:hypothetical protein